MHDVGLAVMVDVTEVGPFGEIDISELLPFELVQMEILGAGVAGRQAATGSQAQQRGGGTVAHDGDSRGSMSGESNSIEKRNHTDCDDQQQTTDGSAKQRIV